MAEYNRSSSSEIDDIGLLTLSSPMKQRKRRCNLKEIQCQRAEKRRRIYNDLRSFTSSDTDLSMQDENINAQSEHKIEADTEVSVNKEKLSVRRKKKKELSSFSQYLDDLEDGKMRQYFSTDDSISNDNGDEDLNENLTLTERLNKVAYKTDMNEEQMGAMFEFVNKWKSSLHLINQEQIKEFTNSLAIEFMASNKPETQARTTYKRVFKIFDLPVKSKDDLLTIEKVLKGKEKVPKQKARALSHALVKSTKNQKLALRNACREIMTRICDREIWQSYNTPEKIDNLHECLGTALPKLYVVLIHAIVQKAKESKLKLKNPIKEVLHQISLFMSGPQIKVDSEYFFDYNIFFNL